MNQLINDVLLQVSYIHININDLHPHQLHDHDDVDDASDEHSALI